MKATGIVRCIDELGRVVIPKEIRTRLDMLENSPVEFFVDDGRVIISRYYPAACVFCGNADVTDFKGKSVCSACLDELKNTD
jgi:transcriptional pleiotropic regulator of transition state genes